jgi:hypothetical protein
MTAIHRILVSLATATALLGLTGCGVTGTWQLDQVKPDDSAREYLYSAFTLNKDGSFAADFERGGEVHHSVGTYTFDDGQLTVTAENGQQRSYDAKLTGLGSRMEVVGRTPAGETVTAIMKRQ